MQNRFALSAHKATLLHVECPESFMYEDNKMVLSA